MTVGGDTAISAFTNCSLPTFSRFINNWNSGSLLHKEMTAVLAAVSEVLKQFGGKETNTEYFAALMTTLEDVVDTDEGVTAVVCLMSMVVKRLSQNVLKHQADETLDKLMKLLVKYMNSDHGALLRNLLKVVAIFLKAKTSWPDSCSDILKILLEFTIHHKPKVRRAAHQTVRAIITNKFQVCGSVHPGCAIITEFCISKLKKSGGLSPSKDVFYLLSLIEDTFGVFPKSNIKTLSETILSVMTLSDSMLTSACLKTLKGLFMMEPKSDSLPADLNAKIISALYDYMPNLKETVSLINWLQLMEAAFVNLKKLDEKLCIGHLANFFVKAVKCWQNEREEVLEVVTSVLKNLLHVCICPSGEVFQQYLMDDPVNNPMHKMFLSVEECLTYQYHKAWKYILNVIAAFFEVMGKHCYTVMLKCLRSLADMHDTYKFPHIAELEKAVGTAIQHMGPKIVLDAIPLQLNGSGDEPDFPRSWLLPLLRDNIKKTELQFFVKHFMPLAGRLRDKALTLQQEQKIVQSKLYDLLCSQIWSLLPGFCNEPTDLKQYFKEVARTLGMLLKEEPSLRMTVLSSLRVLINKNLENEENKMVLANFSKNYLPILFELYLAETKDKNEERVRLAVYETCKSYLQITDKELCKTFFEKALEKLFVTEDVYMQQCMIDICRAILSYVDTSQIERIYEYCKPLLQDSNHTTQKKSFSVFNEICSSGSKYCKLFVKKHLDEIKPILCGNSSGLKPATKALRLNILAHIIQQLSAKEKEFVISIVPEAVLCTKENSVKARAAAFNLLVVIGNTFLEWQPEDQKGALYEYLTVLNAGLVGSPHLISATVLAIGRILYEFKDKMDSNLIHLLIQNTCYLLTAKSREVVVSAISFLKIMFSVMDNADLAQHVEFMVQSTTSISEDNQRHFRFKAKEILTRLIRKFGYEMIAKLVPENYQKQISHIRKMEARKARKNSADIEDEDDDLEFSSEKKASDGFDAILADSDEEMPLRTDTERPVKMSKKRKTAETVIEEHADEIVDLMDPSSHKHLLTKGPAKSILKKTDKSFPVSEDGRLIITEEEDTSLKSKQEKEMDERRELLAELGAFKRKKRKQEFDDDDDDVAAGSSVTKGIHRSLESSTKKTPGAEFRAKKAGGDVKKGKFEPYAYVPLNRQMLNKRKQVKIKGQFKNLVKGAKKGAMVGAKRKMRQARNKKNKN